MPIQFNTSAEQAARLQATGSDQIKDLKISCLMLTRDRFDLFRRSFECYSYQTYANRELVVVANGSADYNELVSRYIQERGRQDVVLECVSDEHPLGYLRNVSLDSGSGDLICQWDDDDLSHPDRLRLQAFGLQVASADASYLLDHLHYFSSAQRLFLNDWRRSRRDLGLASTLLAYKSKMPRYVSDLRSSEDSILQKALTDNGSVLALIGGLGFLYVYVEHGRNTWSVSHHENIARCYAVELKENSETLQTISDSLRQLPIAGPVQIVDNHEQLVRIWPGPEVNYPVGKPLNWRVYAARRSRDNNTEGISSGLWERWCRRRGITVVLAADGDL